MSIEPGDKVHARYLGGWAVGTVVGPASEPGSWVVDDGHGERAFHADELEPLADNLDEAWLRVEQQISRLMPLVEEAAELVHEGRAHYERLDTATVPAAAKAYILAMETYGKVSGRMLAEIAIAVDHV